MRLPAIRYLLSQCLSGDRRREDFPRQGTSLLTTLSDWSIQFTVNITATIPTLLRRRETTVGGRICTKINEWREVG